MPSTAEVKRQQEEARQAIAESPSTGALTPTTLDESKLYLGETDGVSDPDSDAKSIVARIMNAETEAEIFGGPGNLMSSEDMIGKPFTLHDVEFRRSDIEGAGPGVYSLLHVTLPGTTSTVLVTCGARNVMAAAFRAKQLSMLPRGPVTLVEGKKTRQGFTPLWLQDVSGPVQGVLDSTARAVDEEPF
jgi:hypothetical protein